MNLVATHYSCTSPMDYISHHALHSHIPIHHYTNHTAVTNHSLALIVSPHLHLIHTHTFKQHSYMHSPQSLVLAPADISERYSSCYLFSLCLTPDCPTLELWTRACDPDFCLVLFTSLPCLWYSCFCPLTFACLILSIKHLTALGSTRLWPVITVDLFPQASLFIFTKGANNSDYDCIYANVQNLFMHIFDSGVWMFFAPHSHEFLNLWFVEYDLCTLEFEMM